MGDTPSQQSASEPGTPGSKPGRTLVYCELPNNGGTIITTFTDCNNLGGTDVGKVPPSSTTLIACSYNGQTIHTQESDCAALGGTSQGAVTQSGDQT